jgi:D-galactarolactone isomerase
MQALQRWWTCGWSPGNCCGGNLAQFREKRPGTAGVNKVGEAYVKAAPERMLWGSNWPHPNETTKPDDARFLDLLAEWAPSEATRRRILVDNPESLYGFAKAA